MFCKNCGQEIDDKAVICPKCGVPTGNYMNDDEPSAGFGVLSFFFPLVGLILFLVWKDERPLRAKSCGKGALISVIVSVVSGILLGILYGIAIGAAIGASGRYLIPLALSIL